MPITMIVGLAIGVVVLAGVVFIIQDSRAHKRAEQEARMRRTGTVRNFEHETA